MHLKLGAGPELENPSDAQLEAALRALPGGLDSFAILAADDQHYMQAHGGHADGFALEYRDGSEDEHYRCSRAGLSLDEVLAAFRSYRRGDGAYRQSLPWVKDTAPEISWRSQGILLLFLVVAAVLLWKAFG
jgi:hypothetical protein